MLRTCKICNKDTDMACFAHQ